MKSERYETVVTAIRLWGSIAWGVIGIFIATTGLFMLMWWSAFWTAEKHIHEHYERVHSVKCEHLE